METITLEIINQMSSEQLKALKIKWASDALEENLYSKLIKVVNLLGNKVDNRHHYDMWYLEVEHPVIEGCYIKALYYKFVEHWDFRLNNWFVKEVLLINMGAKAKSEYDRVCGFKTVHWANDLLITECFFVPGRWLDIFTSQDKLIANIENEESRRKEQEKRDMLLEMLKGYGTY